MRRAGTRSQGMRCDRGVDGRRVGAIERLLTHELVLAEAQAEYLAATLGRALPQK